MDGVIAGMCAWVRNRSRNIAIGVLALVAGPHAALGQSDTVQQLTTATGSCPSAEATDVAVLSLIPDDRRAVLEGIRIEIEDEGPNYRVTVLHGDDRTERTYSDPRRDCDQRARFSAVFAVLTLMPPQIAEREPRRTAPPGPNPRPEPLRRAEPTSAPAIVHIEIGVGLDAASLIRGDARATIPGAELRGVFGSGPWAIGLGVGYGARRSFELAGIDGSLQRTPIVLFGRWRRPLHPLEFDADAGIGTAIVRVETTGLVQNRMQMRPEAEVRGGAQLGWPVGLGLAPFIAVRLAWVPAPYSIAVAPNPDVGSLPHLWLGGMLGLSLAL